MMKDKKHSSQQVIPFETASYWRDEMNFAEFPLAALGTSTAEKNLVFEDRIFDKGAHKWVKRKVTIDPSQEYGLPTALDEDVLLGLTQLSAKSQFSSQVLSFTRYELIKELAWQDRASSYERIANSLWKWVGITLYYENAWRSDGVWTSRAFNVLNNVDLLDRNARNRRLKNKPKDPKAGKSSVEWNRVVYDSFQAGWLKKLDFDFLLGLETHLSKRMYRFLDKRFYIRTYWVWDLITFACEKMAMSRNYSNWKLKDRLKPAILELEKKGFLEPMPEDRRFRKVGPKQWKVYFARASRKGQRTHSTEGGQVKQLAPALVVPEEILVSFPPEVVAYLDGLTPDERKKLEEEATASASSGKRTLLRGLDPQTQAHRLMLDRTVSEHVLLRLRGNAA